MKAMFVEGGPLDGQIRDLPDGTWSWVVPEAPPLSLTPPTDDRPSFRRGYYERAIGLEERVERAQHKVVPIATPFVWKGWS